MGLLLGASSIYIPQFIRKRKLSLLFQSTSAAFGVKAPSLEGRSYDDCVKLYAQFTSEQAEKAFRNGNDAEIRPRLFQNARNLGQQLKTDLKINNLEEVMQASSIIYRIIKIDFRGDSNGNIIIKRCYFSDYYSGNVCRFVSALDEGLLAGLYGGGRLNFSQRITEGNACCKAHFDVAVERK
jgi:hypothetical protein